MANPELAFLMAGRHRGLPYMRERFVEGRGRLPCLPVLSLYILYQ